MKKNMGKTDRIIRALLALAFLIIGFSNEGLVMYFFLVLTIIMALTSATGVCPLYSPLGITTLKKPKTNKKKSKR